MEQKNQKNQLEIFINNSNSSSGRTISKIKTTLATDFQSNNIIIYPGQSHSQLLCVFNHIGFEPIIRYINPKKKLNDTKAYCVDTKEGTYIEQKTSI